MSAIPRPPESRPPLSVWDAGSLIIGIVIGASLFRVPADVFGNVPGAAAGLALWLAGGLLSLAGALCYCELATAYPHLGGDYVYLTQAYGRWMGFLFGWMRMTVIIPANIGAMAFIFADHALRLFPFSSVSDVAIALAAVSGLTVVNLIGVTFGKEVQNALTLAKLLGLASLIVAGVWAAGSSPSELSVPAAADEAARETTTNYGLALVFVLYAFGGWSDAAFVAADVRDVRRNMPRALLLGLGSITLIYLLVNAAYLLGLGLEGVRGTKTPAADLLQRAWGRGGEAGISLIVMLSTLGAMNGMLFSGARLVAPLGRDHRVFRFFSRWDREGRTPVGSLLVLGGMAMLLVGLVGLGSGGGAIGRLLLPLTRGAAGEGGFQLLVIGTAPVFWMFLCLTGAALPILRRREPGIERPFRAAWAAPPFCLTSLYMLWSSATYAGPMSAVGAAVLLAGAALYVVSERRAAH